MSYPMLAGGFLLFATLAGVLLSRRLNQTPINARRHWAGVLVAGTALIALTAVFDSIMISADLFSYTTELISGIRIGLAPIEDFAYPLALVIALPALWLFLSRPDAVPAYSLLKHAWATSRPVSWVNTAFPFAAAMLLSTREIDWLLIVGTVYYLVPYNLAMYGINDVFDYESDIKNPRKGGIEGALLPRRFHRPLLWLITATNIPFLIVLVAASGPLSWLAIALSSFAVLAYSVPRLRFKERPVLDSITSSTHFVSPAVVGLSIAQVQIDLGLMFLLAAFFFWGMAAHAFGAVQDIMPDREAGIASIATKFGARRTVRFALALWLLAGLLMLATPWPGPLAAVVAAPYLINAAPWWRVTDAAASTNRAWRRFIWLNYAFGFVVTLVMILFWNMSS